MIDTDVLIAGGGPVGLAAALALSRRGLRVLLVERHPGTSQHPKARGVTVRSMELFREWGVHGAMRAALLDGPGHRSVYTGRHLQDPVVSRIEVDDGSDESASPTRGGIGSQVTIEPILREAALAAGAELRFGSGLLDFDFEGDSVRARLDGGAGTPLDVRARWLVGADGARSPIREQLGIAFDGATGLGDNISILIEADLDRFFAARPCRFFFAIDPPHFVGMVGTAGVPGRWLVNAILPAGVPAPPDEPSTHERMVRRALGEAVPFRHVSTMRWRAQARVARRFRAGPVFLAGDAAHVTTPAGGFGMNTGFADVHNLAWKLDWVRRGHARDALLDSYEAERRPVAQWTVDVSVMRMMTLALARHGGTVKELSNGLALGYRYNHGALRPDDTPPPEASVGHAVDVVADYLPTARPGHRAPHVVLADGRSTLDAYGDEAVLLCGPGGLPWRTALPAAARGLPVRAGLLSPADAPAVLEAYGLDREGAVLVRPDGFVAWRSRGAAADPAAALSDAFGAMTDPAIDDDRAWLEGAAATRPPS